MSSLTAGRVSLTRPAVDSASPAMFVSDAPIASRSSASPLTNRCSSSSSVESWRSRSSTVSSTALRLSIVRPMTSSRSASVVVSDAVCDSSEFTFPASPCSVLMISMAKELTSSGFSAANSGLNPLKSTVRSRAGWVWRSGMVPFSVRVRPPPAPSASAT